jgi:hypothetical protein
MRTCLAPCAGSLFLVVHHSAGELRAPQIGSGNREREGLTVGRHNTTTANLNPAGLLVSKRQRMIVDFLVGPRIRIRIPCDRVVFTVDLPVHSLCDGFLFFPLKCVKSRKPNVSGLPSHSSFPILFGIPAELNPRSNRKTVSA